MRWVALTSRCLCQLDLAPFDTLIWPHLASFRLPWQAPLLVPFLDLAVSLQNATFPIFWRSPAVAKPCEAVGRAFRA